MDNMLIITCLILLLDNIRIITIQEKQKRVSVVRELKISLEIGDFEYVYELLKTFFFKLFNFMVYFLFYATSLLYVDNLVVKFVSAMSLLILVLLSKIKNNTYLVFFNILYYFYFLIQLI